MIIQSIFKVMRLTIFCWIFPILLFSCKNELQDKAKQQDNAPKQLKVLAWNILHGAQNESLREDGRPHVIGIIREIDPDVIMMVETYGAGSIIADSLGYKFHLIALEGTPSDDPSVNLSIFSKYPLGERFDFYNYFNIGGIEVFLNEDTKVNVFSIWLNYDPWLDDPLDHSQSPQELVEWEKSGSRPAQVTAILEGLQPFLEQSDSVPVIVGGDFNIWSHLDWQKNTQSLHQNLTVNWWTLAAFEKTGLKDVYREIFPNVLTHPGITWDQSDKKDEHRIDYILYKGKKLKPIHAESRKGTFNQPFLMSDKEFIYPSDHGYVVATFEIR